MTSRKRQKVLLTVPEVELALGVSRSTVWRMIQRGDLPTIKSSGRRMVPSGALAARTARGRRAAPAPFTHEDPLWKLVGAYRSGGTGAEDKHALLDE